MNAIPPSRSKWRYEYGLLTGTLLGVFIGWVSGNWKIGIGIGIAVGMLLQLSSMGASRRR